MEKTDLEIHRAVAVWEEKEMSMLLIREIFWGFMRLVNYVAAYIGKELNEYRTITSIVSDLFHYIYII